MPIDIATGDVELAREDFVLPGRVPLTWTRHFRTALLKSPAPLAPGWTTSLFSSIKRIGKEWHFTTGEGDRHVFADPDERVARGHTIRLLGAFLELVRSDNRLIVTQWDADSGDIQRLVFAAERAGDGLALSLVGIEDVSGDGLELTWDASGRLSSLHQRIENRTVAVAYSPEGRIDSLALLGERGTRTKLVGYEYDDAGRLSAVLDRRGLAHRYEYDARSHITRETLKDGAVYSYRYDERGRCIHFSGLDHYNEKRLQFLEAARTTVVTNSYGKSSVYQCLPTGQIASETDPTGNTHRTIFDEYNRVIAKVDPTGAATRYTYDENGNRDSTTDPLGRTYQFTFNAYHQPLSVTNPMGKAWRREYDTGRRLSASIDPLGARWGIAYDKAGNAAAITDPLGSTRALRYTDGLVSEMTDWMGHATRFTWDAFGRIIERIGPVGERTAFRYDAVGNPAEVQLPDGGRLHLAYDSGDNLSSVTNPSGHVTRLRYGSCRRLLERVDPIGRVVRYQWGTETARLDRVINERGDAFSYFHDDQGRIVRERSFDDREQSFEYDAAGRSAAVINGNGERIQLKRDAAGKLVELSTPDGAITSYEYDVLGRMVAAVSPDIPVRFEYDDGGRLTREIQGEEWVRTEYNAAGDVTRTHTSLGFDVRYELDANGRVRKLSTGDDHALTFERDARGLETGRGMPGGLRLEQRFDSMGRLLAQRVAGPARPSAVSGRAESRITAGDEIVRRDYQYGRDGLLLSIKDGRWGTTDYTYDPAERLLSALRDRGLTEHFEYDATDNLTRIQQQGRGLATDDSHTYDPDSRLLQRGETLYQHDLDGRVVRKTEPAGSDQPEVWDYTWDPHGQLRRLRRPDGQEWEYRYDAFSRRIAKRGPAGTRRYLWSGNHIVQEQQDGGQPTAWVFGRGSFAPLARVRDDELVMVINDHLGTPRELVDAAGRSVWAASLSAWGQLEQRHHPASAQSCPIRFQGQWFDEESGLHYNRFRYYDPANGRFLSQDPVRLAGGLNLFRYARNPTAGIDPLGLECADEGSGQADPEGRTDLFRAIGPAEHADVQQTGQFRNPPGIEGKYFSTTEAGARQYARMAEQGFGDPPYTIVATSIPTASITPAMTATVDRGIPAVVVPTANLPELSPPVVLP